MFKRTVAAITILAAMLCLAVKVDAADNPRHTKDDTWLIYWYVCGADDLEGRDHVATCNIAEMQNVKLPRNINILIYAGGTYASETTNWHHPTLAAVNGEYSDGMYLYNADGLVKLTDSQAENMGDPNTLVHFLKYGEENFSADHKVIIFFNHGGQNGICYDDKFAQRDEKNNIVSKSYLSYDALKNAFGSVYGIAPENPPFELVGFDACVTGSYELANSIADFSRYMVGSEPVSFGWHYTSWLNALVNDPSMNGAQIGKAICNSAMKSYSDALKLTNAFSVIDLTKMPELRAAYESYFNEALIRSEEEGFIGAFARAAQSRKADKYSDMYTDLGLLAKNTKAIMPDASDKLLKAIDKAVVYNKHGAYLKCRGLSTYYPYTSLGIDTSIISTTDADNGFVSIFMNQNANYIGQKEFYNKVFSADLSDFGTVPMELNSNGHFVAKLEPEQLKNVSAVQSVLIPMTAGNGESGFGPIDFGGAMLTSADDIKIDWKKGTVTENFRAVEPVFDGHKILMDVLVSGRGHTLYKVPIYYNGEYKELIVRYDTPSKKYTILGFGSTIENGMVRVSDGTPIPGAIITPIYYMIVSEDDSAPDDGTIARKFPVNPNTGKFVGIKRILGEPFVYTRDSAITTQNITTGLYGYFFRFIAPNGEDNGSLLGLIDIEYGNVTRKSLDAAE